MSDYGRALVEAIHAWTEGLPAGSVQAIRSPVPPDDEYGLETVLELRPADPQACPITLDVTRPQGGSATGIALDDWAHLARRTGLKVKPAHEKLVVLYVEPSFLTVDTVLAICRQVAAGAVQLTAGVWAGRLVSTRGFVPLPGGPFPMNGLGEHWLYSLGAKLKLAETRKVSYASWTGDLVSLSGGNSAAEA